MDLSPHLARLLSQVDAISLDEPMAPCAACVMTPVPTEAELPSRPRFHAPARCCTYQPWIPNTSAGAILRDGGVGEQQLRARMAEPDGVGADGVAPRAGFRDRYHEAVTHGAFGNDASLTCPYWVEGPLGCSVHPHRNAVCRTWSCRRTHGGRGARVAAAARELIFACERRLAAGAAEACTELLPGDGAPLEDWVAYYLACASWCDDLPPTYLEGPRLEQLLATLRATVTQRERPLPLCPIPSLAAWREERGRMVLQPFSPYDTVDAPAWVFELLSRLDGSTPWPEAVAATEQALGETVPADLVPHLWWRGCLTESDAVANDDIPFLPD